MAVGNRHIGTQLSHLTFMAFFALYAGAAGIWLAMGLAPAVAATFPAIHTSLHTWGAGAAATNIAAWDSEAFNLKELAFQTGTKASISFENSHSGGRHNVAIYADASSKEAIFKGEVITGPARTEYTFIAPARGTYYFRCDIYPNMNGSVIVLNGSAAIRSPALAAMAGGIAVASHAAEHAGHVTLQYLFSLVNIGLGVFLMRLRPRDRAARFLALGLVGTGAVFNVQAHSAEAVMPGLASFLHESFHVVSGIAYVYALLLFPDGRLPHWSIPRWIKWPARALYLLTLAFVGLFFSMLSHGEPEGFIAFFGVLIPVAGLTSQAFRYRHAHTAEERQQSRVLMWALILALGTVVLPGISVLAFNVLVP